MKIAICISGQTRHLNKDTRDLLAVLDLFSEYDYDLFGHTWSDQEDPTDDLLNKFVEYRSDNQQIIWDTIVNPDAYQFPDNRPDWSQFFTTERDWIKDTEYQDILNDTAAASYMDFAKARINGHCGQVWSAMESFLLTKKHMSANQYKFVVKLRWDCKINDEVYADENLEDENKQFKKILKQWANQAGKFNVKHGSAIADSTCLTANDCVVYHGTNSFYTNDLLYVIKRNAFNDILKSTTMHTFEQMFLREYITSMPMSHQLWADWLLTQELKCAPVLPDLIRLNTDGNPDDPIRKPNKRWRV